MALVERFRLWLLIGGSVWAVKLLIAGRLAGFIVLVLVAALLTGSLLGSGEEEQEQEDTL